MVDTHWALLHHHAEPVVPAGRGVFTGERTITVDLQDGSTRVVRGERVYINTGSHTTVPPIRPGHRRLPDEHLGHGARRAAGAAGHHRRRLHRFGVRPGFPPARKRGRGVQRGERSFPTKTPTSPRRSGRCCGGRNWFLDNTDTDSVSPGVEGVELRYSRNGDRAPCTAAHGRRRTHAQHCRARFGRRRRATRRRGAVAVNNDRLETSATNVYAIGDWQRRPLFAHPRLLGRSALHPAGQCVARRPAQHHRPVGCPTPRSSTLSSAGSG